MVLITGGSRGIGAATARRFAAGGCKVVINYHRSQAQAEAHRLFRVYLALGVAAGLFCLILL